VTTRTEAAATHEAARDAHRYAATAEGEHDRNGEDDNPSETARQASHAAQEATEEANGTAELDAHGLGGPGQHAAELAVLAAEQDDHNEAAEQHDRAAAELRAAASEE
jgi:hypothetical protein